MADNQHGVVAIVDDDPGVLDSFKFLLEAAGHTVEAHTSAAAFLQSRAVRPSCLILDQHMPTITGLALAARLHADGVGHPHPADYRSAISHNRCPCTGGRHRNGAREARRGGRSAKLRERAHLKLQSSRGQRPSTIPRCQHDTATRPVIAITGHP